MISKKNHLDIDNIETHNIYINSDEDMNDNATLKIIENDSFNTPIIVTNHKEEKVVIENFLDFIFHPENLPKMPEQEDPKPFFESFDEELPINNIVPSCPNYGDEKMTTSYIFENEYPEIDLDNDIIEYEFMKKNKKASNVLCKLGLFATSIFFTS
jgi:hypothetical protein